MHSLYHYTRAELLDALGKIGLRRGDVVSLQVSLGRIGLPQGVPAQYSRISEFVIEALLEILGSEGTLVVPTYTYSIGRGDVYEVETTPAAIGEFPETFRKRPEAIRSRDPMLSSAAIGPAAQPVLREISRSCYGEGSTFHRLRDVGAKICTLGISLYWATFRHHIEEMAGVPFRYAKRFEGVVREGGVDSRETWHYFAAPYVENCQPNGLPLEKLVGAAGLLAVAPVGRGEVMAIPARDYFEFGMTELKRNPWLTAKGPPEAAEVIFRNEAQWQAINGPARSQS